MPGVELPISDAQVMNRRSLPLRFTPAWQFVVILCLCVLLAYFFYGRGILLTSPSEGVGGFGVMWPFISGSSLWTTIDQGLFFGAPTSDGDIWLSQMNLYYIVARLLGGSLVVINFLQIVKMTLVGLLFFKVMTGVFHVERKIAGCFSVAYILLPAHIETQYESVSGIVLISFSLILLLAHRVQANNLPHSVLITGASCLAGLSFYTGNGANNVALTGLATLVLIWAFLGRVDLRRGVFLIAIFLASVFLISLPVIVSPIIGELSRRQGTALVAMKATTFVSWLYANAPFRFFSKSSGTVWSYTEFLGVSTFASLFALPAVAVCFFKAKKNSLVFAMSSFVIGYILICGLVMQITGGRPVMPASMLGSLSLQLLGEYPLDFVLWMAALLSAISVDRIISGAWKLPRYTVLFTLIPAILWSVVALWAMVCIFEFTLSGRSTALSTAIDLLACRGAARPASMSGSLALFLTRPDVEHDWFIGRSLLFLGMNFGAAATWVACTWILATKFPSNRGWRTLLLLGVLLHGICLFIWSENFDRNVISWTKNHDAVRRALAELKLGDRLAVGWIWDGAGEPYFGANARFFTKAEVLSCMHSFVTPQARKLLAVSHGIADADAQHAFDVCHPPDFPFSNRRFLDYLGCNYFLVPSHRQIANTEDIAEAEGWTLKKSISAEALITLSDNLARVLSSDFKNGQISFDYIASRPLTVVVKYIALKNWNAYCNGERVLIFPGDDGLITLRLPAGENKVRLIYQPRLLEILMVTSLAVFLLLASFFLWKTLLFNWHTSNGVERPLE